MSPQSVHQFAEKVALISDGTTPVGRAVALQLALQGSYVIVGFSEASGENQRAVEELRQLGTLAGAVETDMSTLAGARDLAAEAANTFGRVDLLINCLKFVPESSFEDTSDADFSEALDRNLRSTYFLTQAAIEMMKNRPKPKIVNIISALDSPRTRGNALFAASQSAVVGFTQALSVSLPQKFRVNCVAVSDIKMNSEERDADLFRKETAVPTDDVARTVLFLLSGESTGLNGQVLTVKK